MSFLTKSSKNTAEQPAGVMKTTKSALGAPRIVSVNLLPNTVIEARALKGLKRVLALVTVAVIVALLAISAWSYIEADNARSALETERARTNQLTEEQQKYAEVPKVLAQLEKSQLGLLMASSADLRWQKYLKAINAVTPEGVTIESMMVSLYSPVEQAPAPLDTLNEQNPGRIAFTGLSATRPDIALWISGLNSVPGFSNARLYLSSLTDVTGAVSYEVNVTVDITGDAFASPFLSEDGL